jgi:hypothetical protein
MESIDFVVEQEMVEKRYVMIMIKDIIKELS